MNLDQKLSMEESNQLSIVGIGASEPLSGKKVSTSVHCLAGLSPLSRTFKPILGSLGLPDLVKPDF